MPGERVRTREVRRTRRVGLVGRMRRLDWLMLCALAGVAALGLDVIGTGAGGHGFVVKQEIYLALGGLALCVLSFIDVERFRRLEWPLYIGTIALVAAVFALGFSTRGSRRWIQFPFFQFQPSELGKLTLLLALAALIARNAGRIGTLRFVVLCIAYAARAHRCSSSSSPTSARPSSTSPRSCACSSSPACACATSRCSAASLCSSRWPCCGRCRRAACRCSSRTRSIASRPSCIRERNTLAEGYNQSQAKIAVGSGGLVGRGKSGATQTLNDFLPERRTDFVFAVLGEERGFVGAMLLLGLYLVVLWRVLRAIAVARTLYARLICAGVFGWLLASVFISVGMTIGIAPVTGIPLPLLSAGGSSTITVLAAIGVVQSIQLRARLPQRLLGERRRSRP